VEDVARLLPSECEDSFMMHDGGGGAAGEGTGEGAGEDAAGGGGAGGGAGGRRGGHNSRMHPRNQYRDSPPDFAALAARHPSFAPL
jgi:hypothetical protein